jgi:Tol biopolymer transport system component
VYNIFAGARSNLFLVDLEKPDASKLIAEDAESADLSPDGRWLAYCARDPEGPRVYVASFPDLARRAQVTSRAACWPQFGPDGQSLYFSDGDFWGASGTMHSTQRMGGIAGGWTAPRQLFRALSGPFAVSGNPLRFYTVDWDSTKLAREIRVMTGWKGEVRGSPP